MRLLFFCLFLGFWVITGASAASSEQNHAEDIFGLTKIHPFHLTVTAKDYKAMDPPPQPLGSASRSPGRQGQPAMRPQDLGAGNFGFEFEYVCAEFQCGNQRLKDIGLRYKGSGTYMMSQRQAKRSFKIDFDRYNDALAFQGLTKLNLNNGVMDPTKAREALAYAVFRAAGVPAPRTAFAEVTLTVTDKYEKEYLGLYTVVEQVDEHFLKAHFKKSKGLLLKPEGIRGLPYLGNDSAAYEKAYNPRSKPGRGDWKRLVELTRLVNQATEAEFRQKIGDYLDIDNFVRFLAANTLLVSLDGFLGLGHNYYLYQSPETGKFSFIPWDLDLAFGAFSIYGTPEQLVDLSIDHPHLGENKLIDRLLAVPEVRTAYREQLRRLVELFTAEKLGQDLTAIEQVTKDALAKERKAATARKEMGSFGPGGMFGGLPRRTFIDRRAASVLAQLEGKSKGYVPVMRSFGPPGGLPPGNPLAKPLFDTLDTNKDGKVTEEEFLEGMKKLFRTWDKDKNGYLDQREMTEGFQKLIPSGPPRR